MKSKFIFLISFLPIIISYISFYLYNYNKVGKESLRAENYAKMLSDINKNNYEVIRIIKKKNKPVYTQGLIIDDNFIYESGGLYRESSLIKYDKNTFKKITEINLNDKYFGEGIGVCGSSNILYQLTYKERKILLYKYPSLEFIREIKMNDELREGWGLSQGKDNNELYATDGTNRIFILNCSNKDNNLSITRVLDITYNNKKLNYINDLAYSDGFIYANVYFQNIIVKIDPNDGNIVKVYNMINLTSYEQKYYELTNKRLNNGDVFNGIAYDKNKKTFLLTGKLWKNYYEIKFK